MANNEPNIVPYSSFADDEVARAYQEYMGAGANNKNNDNHINNVGKPDAARAAGANANNALATPQQNLQAAQQYMQNFGGFGGYGGFGQGFGGWGQFPSAFNPTLPENSAPGAQLQPQLLGQGQGQAHGPNIWALSPGMPIPPGYEQVPKLDAESSAMTAQSRERFRYFEYECPGGIPRAPSPPPMTQQQGQPAVPVLLCHTCSVCGRMRSAGFHRNNPVVPNKPLVKGVCRRCEKRGWAREGESLERTEDRGRRVTRIRRCTAEEPCDWPSNSVGVSETRRGRARRRRSSYESDEVYVSSREERTHARRAGSGTRFGMKLFQYPRRKTSRIRVRSRFGSISPPYGRERDGEITDEAGLSRYDEYYVEQEEPLPRPPMRSRDYDRHRSPSAEERIASHPMAFRAVAPRRKAIEPELEEAFRSPSLPRRTRPEQSPARGILKVAGMDRETTYRRETATRESKESTFVNLGGDKVHFASSISNRHPDYAHNRREYSDKIRRETIEDRHFPKRASYNEYPLTGSGNPYLETHGSNSSRAPSPPVREFETLRIRRASPSPRARSRDGVEIRYRTSQRIRSPTRSSERRSIQHIRARSMTPVRYPAPRDDLLERNMTPSSSRHRRFQDLDELTDSDDSVDGGRVQHRDDRGDVVDVRTWRGRDEDGRMATFVEETVQRRIGKDERAGFVGKTGERMGGYRVEGGDWREG